VTVIIDASVLSAFLLKEEGWKEIGELLVNGTCATELVITESCNSVLTALRRSRINEQEAEETIRSLVSFTNTNVKIFSQEEAIQDAFKLAKESGLTIYDAIYIALAKKTGATLASRDPRQIEAARRSRIRITAI
jgi:predicted nucleic acid-binding protein